MQGCEPIFADLVCTQIGGTPPSREPLARRPRCAPLFPVCGGRPCCSSPWRLATAEPPAEPNPDPASGPELVKEATPAKTTDQIQINLDVVPNDAQDLGFRMSGAKSTSFTLDDDADALVRNFKVFPSLKAGTYTVALPSMPAGYHVTALVCRSIANGGAGVENNSLNVPGRSITILLEARERVVCTFVVSIAEPLTVTINQAPGQPDPAPQGMIYFRVDFNSVNPVTGFTAEDVVLSDWGAHAVSVDQQPDGSYLVGVDAFDAGGREVSASIPAGAITDVFGQGNEASTSTDNTVYIEMGDMTECVDDTPDDGGICTIG